MKKTSVRIIISSLLIWTTTIVIANADGVSTNTQAGTIDDPVITKSYFEQNVKSKIMEEMNKQSMTEEKVKQLISAELGNTKPSSDSSKPPAVTGSANSSLTVIKLEPGQTLFGGSGTEIIVRTGKVTVTSSDDNGIPDVTSGKDIFAGTTVDLNHQLVIPRDGRGVKSDPKLKQDIYIMVRGSYLLMNADGSKATS
jgi:hypothetical protein